MSLALSRQLEGKRRRGKPDCEQTLIMPFSFHLESQIFPLCLPASAKTTRLLFCPLSPGSTPFSSLPLRVQRVLVWIRDLFLSDSEPELGETEREAMATDPRRSPPLLLRQHASRVQDTKGPKQNVRVRGRSLPERVLEEGPSRSPRPVARRRQGQQVPLLPQSVSSNCPDRLLPVWELTYLLSLRFNRGDVRDRHASLHVKPAAGKPRVNLVDQPPEPSLQIAPAISSLPETKTSEAMLDHSGSSPRVPGQRPLARVPSEGVAGPCGWLPRFPLRRSGLTPKYFFSVLPLRTAV